MSKIKYEDSLETHSEQTVGIIEDSGNASQEGVEYVLSSNEDGIVAYRIVSMEEDAKPITTTANSSAMISQPLQYIVIDNANGYLQAVQSPSSASTTANSNPNIKTRSSIAIAPKLDDSVRCATNSILMSTKATSSAANQPISIFKKRDDRRRATHNEVERRRRDKINHWIMKLGSIIPADGTSVEIGDSGRVSIANVEGQSKGGILSKACEYIQMLQDKPSGSEQVQYLTSDNKTALDKKKYEEEIVRLRGENELLKAILIKHGINYTKERSSFKAEEFS